MKIPEDLSKETLLKICDSHVRHFTRLLELGKSERPAARTVRVDECESYLATWTAGKDAVEAGRPLPEDCVDELKDALYSGDCDDELNADELVKLQAMIGED